jgi:hypothetical protein
LTVGGIPIAQTHRQSFARGIGWKREDKSKQFVLYQHAGQRKRASRSLARASFAIVRGSQFEPASLVPVVGGEGLEPPTPSV